MAKDEERPDVEEVRARCIHLMDIGENLFDYLGLPRKPEAMKRKLKAAIAEAREAIDALERYADLGGAR